MRTFLISILSLFAIASYSQNEQALEKSDSLLFASVELYNEGKYNEAIKLGTEALELCEEFLGKNHPNYAISLNNLALCNSALDNYEEAIRLGTEALKIQEGALGKEHSDYATFLNNLASYNSSLGNYSEAIRLGTEALKVQDKVLGTENLDYVETLKSLVIYNSELDNYEEAIRLTTEILNLQEKLLGKDHHDYVTSLNNLGLYNYNLGNYAEATRLITEALNIQKKVLGKNHPDYVKTLYILALYYSSLDNSDEADRLGTEILNILEDGQDEEYPDETTSLSNLALYNYNLGNYSEAVRLGTEALELLERGVGKEHPEYAVALNNLALYNSDLGNYSEAIRLGTEALSLCEKVFGKEHSDYATSLGNLATFYHYLGNYSEAVRLCTEVLNIRERIHGKDHPDYATSLSNLAAYNCALGNYSEAIRLGTEDLEISERTLGKEHSDYATSLGNLALYNSYLGNYEEAIRLEMEALSVREKTLGKEHPYFAISLNNLANYNVACGYYSGAIRLYVETLNIYEKLYGRNHIYYVISLNNLALCNSYLGNYSDAIKLGTEVLDIFEKILGKNHPDYVTFLGNLALYNLFSNNYSEAVGLFTEALGICEKVLGKKHPNYVIGLMNSTICYLGQHSPNVTKSCVDATQLLSNIIKETFADLTNKERNLFWDKYKKWFEREIHQIALEMPSDSLAANGYNGALLSKGLLLNSEIELNTLLKESGDKEIEGLYNDLKILRLQINRQMEKPIAERTLNVDSLRTVTQAMERTLVQRSKVYGDYTKNMVIEWQQVQKKLGNKDVAIEFVSFPMANDSVMYAAYCLRKGMATPKMYPLFEARQLRDIAGNAYTGPEVSRLVWEPLAAEMKNAKNVYFSPSGELYNIAIESMPDYDEPSRLVSERWNLYRLSSTRELALIKDRNDINKSAVYGGLTYNTDATTLINDSKNYATTRELDFSTQNIADSLELRNGVKELPQTRVEAQNIDKALAEIKVDNKLYTDTIGTEASFKALSGQKRNLLHIATHGFYWTDSEVKNMKDLSFLMLNEDKPRYTEDKAMTRSGLLLAGANNALMGKQLPENVDDGILTAKEISSLDLRSLDLVVLSACQTGLGEITGDGVFGLQRGFKKAGAQTLMMSLWKVDDNATQMLMTQFYANLVSGKSKFESLREAQRYVREYEVEKEIKENAGIRPLSAQAKEKARKSEKVMKKIRPYQSPEYWAAFILLDATD